MSTTKVIKKFNNHILNCSLHLTDEDLTVILREWFTDKFGKCQTFNMEKTENGYTITTTKSEI